MPTVSPQVTSQRMQGVLLLVLAKYYHLPFLRGVRTETTRTGLGGYWVRTHTARLTGSTRHSATNTNDNGVELLWVGVVKHCEGFCPNSENRFSVACGVMGKLSTQHV